MLPIIKNKSYTTLIIINYICSYPPPFSLICSDSFLQKTWCSYIIPITSLMMIRMSCRNLDSEDMYVQVRRNLIANTDTVADQIKERENQGNPKYNIFINKAVKILVQKQKCWTYECCVMQMHFTFRHVCNL